MKGLRYFLKENNIPENDELYFAYSSTLRISGDINNSNEISEILELTPTHFHRKGEKRTEKSRPYKMGLWGYSPDIPEEKPLEEHINALWDSLKHKKAEILKLKEKYEIDIFNGYRSNSDTAGFEVPYSCLEMFIELKISFGVSIIIT
ncbi:MAG: DUF4279 domain-containing protein [Spirochaetales bacterium]|nr:DUF4279 domain-containing protein [Spirochaetales bacterium]